METTTGPSRKLTPILLPLLLLGLAPAMACAEEAKAAPAHAVAVEASNTFALDAYGVLRSSDRNVVFCPFGLHRLMSLALEGARGKTEENLNRRLHWSATREARHESLTALAQGLGASMQGGRLTLQSRSRLWLSSRGTLQPGFGDVALRLYGAKAETMDFSDPRKAIAAMNGAIATDTNGRVGSLLPPGAMDSNTTLVLASTVFFKGLWSSPFDAKRTAQRPFLLLDKMETKPCFMMLQKSYLSAYEDAEVQALSMAFSGCPDVSMLFLLPVKRGALRELEKALTADRLRAIANDLQGMTVMAYVPRFSFSVGGNYGAILTNLGMDDIFDANRAELQGISDLRPHIRDVWHETTIEINELGGEAAAATAMSADPFGPAPAAPPQRKTMVFNADHPFLFMVRHEPTGLVLFLGRYAGP